MVRPDIKSDECPDLDTECEIKWIEIRPNDKDQILIGSFNRPPDSDEKAIQESEKSLSKIKSDKNFMSGLTIMSTPPSFLSMSSFRSFLHILYW
jgi:endonuclease/exonuclease/phosphatase family metal-dependent hydrolase